MSNPANPVLLDTFDTSSFTGENFEGCFGVYPYADNRVVYASDRANGLYLFRVEGFDPPATGVKDATPKPVGARLVGNFPNPFNPVTTIAYELDRRLRVTLSIVDPKGRIVQTIVDGIESAGRHDVVWNGTDATGARVASGVYFVRLEVDGRSDTRRMVLLK